MRRTVLTLFVTIVLLAPARPATACQCTFYDLPLCVQYWRADAVFTGTVTEVELFEKETPHYQRIQFRVDEAFRGVDGENVDVYRPISMCDPIYRVGEMGLMFAVRDSVGYLWTGMCAHVDAWEGDKAELGLLRALAKGGLHYGVYGRVRSADGDSLNGEKVEVVGARFQQTVTTDEVGRFRLELPRAGTYRVHLNSKDDQVAWVETDENRYLGGLTQEGKPFEIDVSERRCRYAEFIVIETSHSNRR